MSDEKSKKRKVEFLTPMCPEHGATVRADDGTIALLRPLKDGENLAGIEAVKVGERNEDGTYDIEPLYDGRTQAKPAAPVGRKGPGYYATAETRASWDRIFGKKKTESDGKAN